MTELPQDDLEQVFRDTRRDVWSHLNGARIFVTGGTGFFGIWLLESFAYARKKLALDADMIVLTRDIEAFRLKCPHLFGQDNGITFVKGDVRSFHMPGWKFDYLIHAGNSADYNNPLDLIDTIVQGTRHVLEFAVQSKVTRMLYVSSGAVYGKQPNDLEHVSEDFRGAPDILSPASAYGEAKRMAEFLCSIYSKQHGMNISIARPFAFVGPHLPLDRHFAIGNFIRDAMAGELIRVIGDGSPIRSYLYASDLVVWLWHILVFGENLQPYNVGSDEPFSIKEIAWTTGESFNPIVQTHTQLYGPGAIRTTPAERYIPSVERVKMELDLRQTVGLKSAIRRTVEWYQNQSLHEKTL